MDGPRLPVQSGTPKWSAMCRATLIVLIIY